MIRAAALYLIEILHQTTTNNRSLDNSNSCILSKFYIKPQLFALNCFSGKSCILLKFYIKPQRGGDCFVGFGVVSYRNSTSNHNYWHFGRKISTVVSYRNSTSNHNFASNVNLPAVVVSYRNSTSNHNIYKRDSVGPRVVSYRNSTSNHNFTPRIDYSQGLYLIEILHQTTTYGQTKQIKKCCILSKFYIKPQPPSVFLIPIVVVSYRNSTSNHNLPEIPCLLLLVVSYRNSTSNHNLLYPSRFHSPLYLIEILHQTTTAWT